MSRADDTTELMEQAAQVGLCVTQLDCVDSTQALLKTFAWVEPPEEETYCLVSTEPPQRNQEQQLGSRVQENNQPDIKIIPGRMQLNC